MLKRMTGEDSAEVATRELWHRIDSQAWEDLADVLDPDLRVEYVHTGEILGRDAFIRVNREYPGQWAADIEDVVSSGARAVTRVRVSDGNEAFYVASFGRIRDGRIVELVEVWADSDATPPADRRPAEPV